MFRYHINFGRKEMYIFSEKPDSLGTLWYNQCFDGGNLKESINLKDLDIDGQIILEGIMSKYDGNVCTL